MKYLASTQKNVKLNNQKLILHYLTNHEPVSRAKLAEALKSTKPTISKNVDELLRQNRLIEVGKADNMVGKKATLLDINKDYGHVFVIDLSKHRFKLGLIDLTNSLIAYEESHLKDIIDPIVQIDYFLFSNSYYLSSIKEIIISYPGIVGEDMMFYFSNEKDNEILLNKLKTYLYKIFQIEPRIFNDVNLAVIAEKQFGIFKNKKNIYYISGDRGIGSAMILNNQLFVGDRNAAGEIGFVLAQKKEQKEYISIENRISLNAITKRFKDVGFEFDYKQIKEKFRNNNPLANEIYNEIVEEFSFAISNVASILDISCFVVSGRLFELKDRILDDIKGKVSKMIPFKTFINKGTVEHPSVLGAGYIGIKSIMDD